VVTHPLCVQEVPGSIPSSGKGFYVFVFLLFGPKTHYLSKSLQVVIQC